MRIPPEVFVLVAVLSMPIVFAAGFAVGCSIGSAVAVRRTLAKSRRVSAAAALSPEQAARRLAAEAVSRAAQSSLAAARSRA